MQRIFLHRGDEEAAIGREDHPDMRAFPFQFDGLCRRAGPDQRCAVIACNRQPLALRRKGDGFDAAFLRKFLHLAVGRAHPRSAARRKTDSSAGACCDSGHPFARNLCKFAHRSIDVGAAHATVFAAGDERFSINGNGRAQQPVMGGKGPASIVKLMDRAIGHGEEGNAADKARIKTMTFKVERSYCRHRLPVLFIDEGISSKALERLLEMRKRKQGALPVQSEPEAYFAWLFSKPAFRAAGSSSRPMKTRRLSRFSSSFQARW